jgi:putative spermidine/putrescine transport system substrate-binding protein
VSVPSRAAKKFHLAFAEKTRALSQRDEKGDWEMNRTLLLGLGAAVVVAAGVVGWVMTGGSEKTSITVVSWGGAYTKSQIEAYHKPFMASNPDISINSIDYDGNIAPVKAKVESGNVDWDVVDFEVADAIRACDEGLLETLDTSQLPPAPDGTPAASDFIPSAVDSCYVATIVFSHVMAYNTAKFQGEQPSSAADFFDVAKFPGKRGLRKISPKVNLELALLADGVAPSEIYSVLATPAGVDRAFAKLDAIKSEIVWWDAGSQAPQLLGNGTVTMTTAYNGRIFDAITRDKQPFKIMWTNQLLDTEVFGIVKGTPNKEEAFEFLKFATSTGPLADQARWIAYAPARNSSIRMMQKPDFKHATLGIAMLEWMPTAPQNHSDAVPLNHRWWADHQDELTERWSAWIAK